MRGIKAAVVGAVLTLFAATGCATHHHAVVTYDSNGNVVSSQNVPDYNPYGYGYQNGYYFDYYNPVGLYIGGVYYAPYRYRYSQPQRYYSVTPPPHVHLYSGTTTTTTKSTAKPTTGTSTKKVTPPRTTTTVPKTVVPPKTTTKTGTSTSGGGSRRH